MNEYKKRLCFWDYNQVLLLLIKLQAFEFSKLVLYSVSQKVFLT
jgi:hypothetical protein